MKVKIVSIKTLPHSFRTFYSFYQVFLVVSIIESRCTSIWTKLRYQFLDWTIVRHCPKGQLGQIWVNLGQNWGRARSRKNRSILEGKWGPKLSDLTKIAFLVVLTSTISNNCFNSSVGVIFRWFEAKKVAIFTDQSQFSKNM